MTYGCYAYFRPGRHGGEFSGSVDTNPETAGAAIEAMLKVFNDMRTDEVSPTELAEAKSRVAGGMVMDAQTIAQQAGRRIEQILNDYPIDYYDNYPRRVGAVTADQVREVMRKYVDAGHMTFIIVAPADKVKDQLKALGPVEVIPMPSRRGEGAPADGDLLRSAPSTSPSQPSGPGVVPAPATAPAKRAA